MSTSPFLVWADVNQTRAIIAIAIRANCFIRGYDKVKAYVDSIYFRVGSQGLVFFSVILIIGLSTFLSSLPSRKGTSSLCSRLK